MFFHFGILNQFSSLNPFMRVHRIKLTAVNNSQIDVACLSVEKIYLLKKNHVQALEAI